MTLLNKQTVNGDELLDFDSQHIFYKNFFNNILPNFFVAYSTPIFAA